jgi:uncharacterized membrane protein
MQTEDFLALIDDDKVSAAIENAERRTSGEVRVFVTRKKVEDALAAARAEFARLGMHQTAERNAALILVAPASQTFAIFGDQGIHEKCGATFWEGISKKMSEAFKAGRYTEGLVAGLAEIGEALGKHFPYRAEDKNELPNQVVRD